MLESMRLCHVAHSLKFSLFIYFLKAQSNFIHLEKKSQETKHHEEVVAILSTTQLLHLIHWCNLLRNGP